MEERVILVDENNNEIGTEEKLKAHREGKLHRFFSILIFNSKGELLLQKRAKGKYHSGGLWSNTCCGHPRPGEKFEMAAERRLNEEMNIAAKVNPLFHLRYKHSFSNGLTENELGTVFVGYSNEEPMLNKTEAEDSKWLSMQDIAKDIGKNSDRYTVWFKLIVEKLQENSATLRFK